MQTARNIWRLTVKELISLRRDTFMLILIFYAFSLAVYSQATGKPEGLENASIGVVDEDHSQLSRRIFDSFLPPLFQKASDLSHDAVDQAMAEGRFTFVLDIPPDFQSNLAAGESSTIQLLVDATAMMQAGLGASYTRSIVSQEIERFFVENSLGKPMPVTLQIRPAFNEGLVGAWFSGTMGMLNNITMLSVLLAGAALLREREHGTLEHLLVMPVGPLEIMLSKVLANMIVILTITALCVYVMLKGVIGLVVSGSVPLLLIGVLLYLFFSTSLGIFLGTVVRSMPQMALLFILLVIPMNMLSGANTPVENMEPWMQKAVQVSPATHLVAYTQAILFRGAGFSIVWPGFLVVFVIGAVFFVVSYRRFRSFLAAQ